MTEEEWKALAAKNPMRVTYPNWRPKEQRLAEAQEDPWASEVWSKREGANNRAKPRYVGKKLW